VSELALISKKVKIRGTPQQGSAYLLNGPTGTVIALLAIAPDWAIVYLDENLVPYREWLIPADTLIPVSHTAESLPVADHCAVGG
jgi:hypothetical protein